ncbi:glycosyltransferase family 2 protein [Sporomusa sp.]|uniref:glycosyltransferase family 2 protein n=1 Tax=Sporomusa sp. TaxID=2078658 RepID=UPI002CA43801|nr:glycosyltransferase family 2 protein [Sporomusa sp.]HWR44305.1 glycosyltransferase family 2 protein [Sporomusa sp.]
MSLSVLILAKNEEQRIADCIKSASFADEIIVIDDYSTDNTVTIATELGARVVQRGLDGNWGEQQTFAILQATTDWIFFLDADERINLPLREEIEKAVALNERVAYRTPRLNHLMGYPLRHGGWYPDYVPRLFPRDSVRFEGLVHPAPVYSLALKTCKSPIIHYTYSSWEQYFNKLNVYTKLAAEKNALKGKQVNFLGDIVLRPMFAFIKLYILRAGWRDGKAGFILAVFHYFYTMAKYVKLYYIQNPGSSERENRNI